MVGQVLIMIVNRLKWLVGQVSHQLGSLMDLYTTFTNLAGGSIPTDRVVDGIDLSQALFKQTVTDR